MTNITINITTLNLTAGEAARSHPLPLIIGALIHRAMEEAGNAETSAATPGDVSTGSTNAVTGGNAEYETGVDVLAFLRQSSDFEYRTADAIRKHFADNEVTAMDVLDNLVAAGHVITKRRRADGVTLYKAATSAPVASEATTETVATPPELTETNVRSFLGSDPRYTKRSITAICEHFGREAYDVALVELLEQMVDDGDVSRTTRRSDSATLYELA